MTDQYDVLRVPVDFRHAAHQRRAGCGRLARVQRVDRGAIRLLVEDGTEPTVPLGPAMAALGLAVGDWLVWDGSSVDLLDRHATLMRGSKGHADGQILAVNFDIVLLVLDVVTAARESVVERLASIGWDSGATPVLVVTKSDLGDPQTIEAANECILRSAPGVERVVLSSHSGDGLDELTSRLSPSTTSVMIGHSGVGKSSLVNAISGDAVRAVGGTRTRDGKGRHTTSSRQLIDLGDWGYIIDTPGVRELGVQSVSSVNSAFADVASLAVECRFADCAHRKEPGCAVRSAFVSGELSEERYRAYLRLLREADFAESKSAPRQRVKNTEWNRLARAYRKARGY